MFFLFSSLVRYFEEHKDEGDALLAFARQQKGRVLVVQMDVEDNPAAEPIAKMIGLTLDQVRATVRRTRHPTPDTRHPTPDTRTLTLADLEPGARWRRWRAADRRLDWIVRRDGIRWAVRRGSDDLGAE